MKQRTGRSQVLCVRNDRCGDKERKRPKSAKASLNAHCVLALMTVLGSLGCGSGYTIIDRSTLAISKNSRVSANNLVPSAANYPGVVEQLALAQEVYQRQLFLLKERRNKLRARKRYLNAMSFGTFAVSSMLVGRSAIQDSDENATGQLRTAGATALTGLAIGTLLQVTGYMQESAYAIDAKVRHLELLYDTMIERLQQLSFRHDKSGDTSQESQADMGIAIESFITQALAINVKG